METNNFYNNGSFNDKAMGLIKNGAYLAKKAYDNKDKLDNLSKPLNNIDTKNLTPKSLGILEFLRLVSLSGVTALCHCPA